jgi:hypothetical protein
MIFFYPIVLKKKSANAKEKQKGQSQDFMDDDNVC